MRLDVIARIMDEKALDAVVLANPENIRYLTGFFNPVQRVRPNDLNSYFVMAKGEKPALITNGAGIGLTAELGDEVDICLFSPFPIQGVNPDLGKRDADLMELVQNHCFETEPEAIADVLRRGTGKLDLIGTDLNGINFCAYRSIAQALSETVRPVNIHKELENSRKIKSPEEVGLLRNAARITEQAFLHTLNFMKDGKTEQDLCAEYESQLVLSGAQPLFAIIGIDSNGAYPNWLPGGRALENGSVVRFDIGCQYRGYCADIARTVVFGTPRPGYSKRYQAVLKGFHAALSAIRPGALASDIFSTATDTIRGAGLFDFDRLHCGHGIGMSLYEGLRIAPDDHQPLQAGMVFCLETPYYVHGDAGFQVENMIHVTEDGFESLTTIDDGLYIV